MECVTKTKDADCAASLLKSGYRGGKTETLREIVLNASKTATHGSWKLALAQEAVQSARYSDAFKLAQEAPHRKSIAGFSLFPHE